MPECAQRQIAANDNVTVAFGQMVGFLGEMGSGEWRDMR
jgi:hypothetical protein